MDRDDLFQLGMGLPSTAQTEVADTAGSAHTDERLDFFVRRGGERCAGVHLIVDLWGAKHLEDLGYLETVLRDCVAAAGATLLHIHLHHFTPNGGVSGVAVLAESHISIHTWPEADFAALDVFMCGDTCPEATVPVLEAALEPERISVRELLRGRGV